MKVRAYPTRAFAIDINGITYAGFSVVKETPEALTLMNNLGQTMEVKPTKETKNGTCAFDFEVISSSFFEVGD